MKPFIVPDQGTYEVTKYYNIFNNINISNYSSNKYFIRNLVQHKPYQANMEDRMFLKHDPFVKKG